MTLVPASVVALPKAPATTSASRAKAPARQSRLPRMSTFGHRRGHTAASR